MRCSIALAAAMFGTPLAAHDIRVVSDIPVAHSLVSMVLGQHGTAELMLDQGANAQADITGLASENETILAPAQDMAFVTFHDVTGIFPEAAHDPALVTTMIEGIGLRLGETFDPAGSLLHPGAGPCGTLTRNMAQSMADCAKG